MLFGARYKFRFTLSDGRSGKSEIEARFATAEQIIDYARKYVAFECGVSKSDVKITEILES